MNYIYDLSQRLRSEALRNYSPRIPSERFADAVNTLNFLNGIHAPRDMGEVTVSVGFMQNLCTLGRDGFEAASGYRYEHEKEALNGLLDKLWYNFTAALVIWVEKQDAQIRKGEPLWYSCFQVPKWFINEVVEQKRLRTRFTRV